MPHRKGNSTIKFVLSVDTEEEWDWSGPFPQADCQVENIKKIPEFQAFCEKLSIKPTYFVDYAVANDSHSVSILKQPLQNNTCEIAAHLHPWCNPPYFGDTLEKQSHVINLPLSQVEKKLATLTEKLTQAFEQAPTAFRTGRWGISGEILALLAKYNYQIDSSVYPYYSHEYFSCQGAPIKPYFPSFSDSLKVNESNHKLLQYPVSVGFNHADFDLCNRWHERLSKGVFKMIRSIGLGWHLGILKKLYMCPELSSAEDMCLLADKILERGDNTIHMYLHSSSLLTGATGFINSDNAFSEMTEKMKMLVEHVQKSADIEFCTISEAAEPYFKAQKND